MQHDSEINTCGQSCPIPLVYITKAISGMKPGEVIKITGDDPIFESGIHDFCEGNDYKILNTEAGEGRQVTMWVEI